MSRLRALLHELADELANHLEAGVEQSRYYDQDSSPLPSETHCRLVRAGLLPGFVRHRRVLVLRHDMHRYIETAKLEPLPTELDRDAVVTAGLKQLGMRRTG